MFKKLIFNNKTYILPILLFLFVGNFYYQDAGSRIALSNELEATFAKSISNFGNISPDTSNVRATSLAVSPIFALNTDTSTTPEVETKVEQENEETSLAEEPLPLIEIILPYTETNFSESSEWIVGYGAYSFSNDNLQIGGEEGFAASLVLLSGAEMLTDYTFETTLDWNRGASISLGARFEDFDNFVSCSFGNYGAQVSIVSTDNGERLLRNVSPRLPIKAFEPWKDLNYGIRVEGSVVECLVNGETVIRDVVEGTPSKGAPAIAIWAPNKGEALVTVKTVSLNNL